MFFVCVYEPVKRVEFSIFQLLSGIIITNSLLVVEDLRKQFSDPELLFSESENTQSVVSYHGIHFFQSESQIKVHIICWHLEILISGFLNSIIILYLVF